MLIKGAGKNEISENGLFVRMMPHKRQGVRDLFNYSLDFTSEDFKILQMTFFFVEGKILITRKIITVCNFSPSSQCSSTEKVRTDTRQTA